MTLVGAWVEHGTQYLIGDVLLHRKVEPGSEVDHIAIPTRDDVTEILPLTQEKRLSGLCQKIYKISDTLENNSIFPNPLENWLIYIYSNN